MSVQNSHEEFDKFWSDDLEISKICTLMGSFWPKYILFELKKSIGHLCLMPLNIDATFEGKLTCAFKKQHEELSKMSPAHFRKSKHWDFDGILLSKEENVWTWNLRGSFVSWQWRMIQNLKRNWLVSLKLTWGIWWILTWALENLKNLHFNGMLLNKLYNVWAKNSIKELCLMAVNTDGKFEGKMTCVFKNDMRNLANFHQSTFESLKIGSLMGSSYPK